MKPLIRKFSDIKQTLKPVYFKGEILSIQEKAFGLGRVYNEALEPDTV